MTCMVWTPMHDKFKKRRELRCLPSRKTNCMVTNHIGRESQEL